MMRGYLAMSAVLFTLAAPGPGARAEMGLAATYTLNCSGCHGEDGLGVPERGIPNLNDAGRYVVLPEGRSYLVTVPGLSQSTLNDPTAAKLLNYVLHRFAADRLPADFQPYTTEEITRFRSDKASDAVNRRKQILADLRARGLLPPDYGAGVVK